MITLRECHRRLLMLLEAKVDPNLPDDNYPQEWLQIVTGLDFTSLFALSKVANDYEDQAQELFGMAVDNYDNSSTFEWDAISSERWISSAVADFVFARAHGLPSNSRKLDGADMVLFFWYMNEGGFYDLLSHYETKKRAYEVLAIIHDLEPSYVEKKYKSYKHATNRTNKSDAPIRLYRVLLALPEEARRQVSEDFVKAVDNNRGEDLPEAYSDLYERLAKETRKK